MYLCSRNEVNQLPSKCCSVSPIIMGRAHSPSFQSLHLRHSSFSFSKLSVTSPMSQLILQPFPRFTYVTTHSPTLPLLHLHHSSFSNPSFASPTSQDFHLRHLASRLCLSYWHYFTYSLTCICNIC